MEPRKYPDESKATQPYGTSAPDHTHPSWWTDQHTSAWERVKEAFRHEWEQTKAGFSMTSDQNRKQESSEQARERMVATSNKATKEVAKAEGKIAKEYAKLDVTRRDTSEKLAKEQAKVSEKMFQKQMNASEKISRATDKAKGNINEANAKVDDAIADRDSAREAWEQAEREASYGFAARAQYASMVEWNTDLENLLRAEWDELDTGTPWETARTGIRHGWEYARQSH